jgi:hypothetical protein
MDEMRVRIFFLIILLSIAAASSAAAREFHVFGGWLQNTGDHDQTYSYQFEYRQSFHENLAFSITYLNEGAFPEHSRDGHAAQLWAGANLLDRRLSLAFGAGPYFYYDTIPYSPSGYSLNDHGWGALLSLDATWYIKNRWLILFRTNWVATGSSIDTVSASIGVGCRLDAPTAAPSDAGKSPQVTTRNEITLFAGQSSVHNKGPAHSFGASLEYRRRLMRYLDGTAGFIYEGSSTLSERYGLATQLTLTGDFLDDKLSLGFGGGPYFAIERRSTEEGQDHMVSVSKLVTMTAAYRLAPNWGTRFSWHRVITNYERDADVWLLGIGYLF